MDDRSLVVAQAMILETKKYWTTKLYPALKEDYQHRASLSDTPPKTVDDVRDLIGGTTDYQVYAWLERHLQRYKYSGRYGLAPYHRERRDELLAPLAGMTGSENLDVDPDFDQPKYYRAVDIHQHPGGVWTADTAGFEYERGARSTTPMMGGKHRDLHQRFTDLVAEGGTPSRVLDMGCGFGKSTQPFYESFADARIDAIDLSAPCVTLGAYTARQSQASKTRFRQMSACETDYDDSEFDLVTSTMLIHELPPPQIEQMFDESLRLLQPGGRMVHLDFHELPDVFSRFIHYGHGRRNNEPFMEPWAEMDVVSVLKEKGFKDVTVKSFAEAEGVDAVNSPVWRFPWTVISAVKP
jgi:ubiquinone/menaquinone biosynthesis C-methylase UbiE